VRIGLDISSASGSYTGVGNYAFKIAQYLPRVAPNDEWIFLGPSPALMPALVRDNVRVVGSSRTGLARVLWEQTALPLHARREAVRLLHGADFSRPVLYRGPTANTVHGVSPFSDKPFYPPLKRAYKRALIRTALRYSDAIITVSEFTRNQVIERFNLEEGRVFAIHHGVENSGDLCEPKSDPPYVLFVGNLETRKNLAVLVEAFRILRTRFRVPHRLVLAGAPGYGWEPVRSLIERSGLSEAIDLPGYVSEAQLAQLYRSGALLAFPAFWEDFGLPVVEAMAAGMPVVCARAAALPEVAGDAAEYFDPSSAEDMATAMHRVLLSNDRWIELREKGLARAARFTWEESARKHVTVYRAVLSNK
jgi:glycosyltransferase involved in cell wall biosynthesis